MIADKVKAILTAKGMKQTDLAAKMGKDTPFVSRALKVGGNPTLNTLQEIAKALDVELVELFSSENPRGFIEFKGEIRSIHSVNDLHALIHEIEDGE
ncbi:helix-turn-helix transcriptional regulator [Cytophaga sp. FL35]|uniref:helix-turn-helix domain-containing protein n=1 Tax=Cytophaga sp. FL35 TaxID=1904456 RepID=UPI001653C362|nr:helix-turn-helix transcriptional regulator [Cytophaga sp. FL35]MBC6999685.1 helix-turn-helix transcriptional regulator [Cytophaga sp. FL35]